MANKVLIIVIGAVVLASLVVGGLLGMQFAGGNGDATPADQATPDADTTAMAPGDTTETERPSTTTKPSAVTATSTTPEAQAAFDPASVNTTAVEYHLRNLIHEKYRNGSERLDAEPTLDEMAQFHSDNMVSQGYPNHVAGGYSARGRYEEYDMYSRCRVPNNNNAGVRDGVELETIGRIALNQTDQQNETQIAQQLLDKWSEGAANETLSLQHAEKSGVGITVSTDARVYATVNLC